MTTFNSKTFVRADCYGEIKLLPVIASYRHASGHVFLIHSFNNTRFSATYAPTGSRITTANSIQDVLSRLADVTVERINDWYDVHCAEALAVHFPSLSPETGLDHATVWREVQRSRFESKQYKALPQLESLRGISFPSNHYLHLSTTETEDDFVAFTPSESYGENDRQVRLRFGKYLRKAFSPDQLSDETIKKAVTELRAKLARAQEQLLFATDRETINEIFETEMNACSSCTVSCMWGKFSSYTKRPYHVYANSPDVAVAYVLRDELIIARSVVSVKDKLWIRAYSRRGDETLCQLLTDLLEEKGYRQGSLEGNRLSKVDRLMPYLDGDDQSVNDGGDYWVVAGGETGDYQATQTNGEYEDNSERCPSCECHQDACECSYCECCDERFQDGCPSCNICESCDRCHSHDECRCTRCSDCHALIDNCSCDRCENCSELSQDCECASEDDDAISTETETLTTGASL